MKVLIWFACLVALWAVFFPAMNDLERAPASLRIWFVTVNVVITVKLLIDVHTHGWKL